MPPRERTIWDRPVVGEPFPERVLPRKRPRRAGVLGVSAAEIELHATARQCAAVAQRGDATGGVRARCCHSRRGSAGWAAGAPRGRSATRYEDAARGFLVEGRSPAPGV